MPDNEPAVINRIVAFAGPYIAIISGALADWLLVHLHVLALFHTTHTQVAGAITQLVVFGLTAILVWLGQQKWLTGWQNFETATELLTPSPPTTALYPPTLQEARMTTETPPTTPTAPTAPVEPPAEPTQPVAPDAPGEPGPAPQPDPAAPPPTPEERMRPGGA